MIAPAIRFALGAALIVAAASAFARAGDVGEPVGAISMHGEPALPPSFALLPLVNPVAPKGGCLDLSYLSAFDSLFTYYVQTLSIAHRHLGNVYALLITLP